MSAIISIENVSKKFIIGHEEKEKYTALRDVIAKKASNLLSFGRNKAPKSSTEEFWALKDVSFNVNQGDRVGIVGRNGAGKSTLLKVLSRITEPTGGRITLRGRVASLLEVGTGFHPELTGRENIFLNGAVLGMNRTEIRKKFDEIVAFAEVEKFLDTPVKRYSSGMYVRLAFAVAAHLEPEILIVDEVLAVGDAQFQKKCLGKMDDVSRNEGRTVLFVSHNMGVIAQLCNTCVLLNQGQVLTQGDVKNVIDKYVSGNASAMNTYQVDRKESKKKNFFYEISTLNSAGEVVTDYSFTESIKLSFYFSIKETIPNLQIGIGLKDKFQNSVFTILKPVDYFKSVGDNCFHGIAELPSSLIAPNFYSFVFAIWTKEGNVYDIVENICPVRVHDDGTDLALYEGVNYGSVIVNANWTNA